MRVLHVLTSAKAEGTPNLVLSWLPNKEVKQDVLLLTPEGELLEDLRKECHVVVNRDFVPTVKKPWKIIRLVRTVCKELQPDVVISWPTGHSQWIHAGASLAGVKSKLTHIGNLPGNKFVGRYAATALTFWTSLFLGVKFVACSNHVAQEYKKIALVFQKINVVYNSFDTNKFTSLQSTNRTDVTMIGYMEPVRDHKTLLSAWDSISEEISGELNLIGEGSLLREMQAFVDENNISKVNFLGRVTNVREILNNTKVYVLCTKREGFGITLLEALASGCEVVATDLPAVREVLANGVYGSLFPVGDVYSLAETIKHCYGKASEVTQNDEQKLKYLNSFTPKAMMNGYLKVSKRFTT